VIIEKVTITHVRVPLREPFRISSGAVAEKDAIVVRLESGGLMGFGESSPMSGSFYSSDTPESCWQELRDHLIPPLLGKPFDSPLAAAEWVGGLPGSNFAKAGIETAFWDLEARRRGKPLYELLGGERRPVESGLAVGLYDDVNDLSRREPGDGGRPAAGHCARQPENSKHQDSESRRIRPRPCHL
jgi:O-succinylbenzoate synthase